MCILYICKVNIITNKKKNTRKKGMTSDYESELLICLESPLQKVPIG